MALRQSNLLPHPNAPIATAPQKPQQPLQGCCLTQGTLPKHCGPDLINYVYLQIHRSWLHTNRKSPPAQQVACLEVIDELLSDGCHRTPIEPWQGCQLRLWPACSLWLWRGPYVLGRLTRGMSERPRARWERIQSPTPAACRLQSGVKCQHLAARRFLGTYILLGEVSCAFFFFHLFENLALGRKGLCTGSVSFSNVFAQNFSPSTNILIT